VPERILFIADQFAQSPGDGTGRHSSAELTDAALIEASPWPVETVRTSELEPARLRQFDVHLLGALTEATPEQLEAIAVLGRAVLLEQDYRICRWRGNFARSTSAYHRKLWRCNCRMKPTLRLIQAARGAIFLTHRQLGIYRTNPFVRLPRHAVLGCSVMGAGFFEAVARFRNAGSPAGTGTCLLYSDQSTGGHEEAIAYCKREHIEAAILRDTTPEGVRRSLAAAARLVFLPQWPEPSSEVALEARFLGCELISNEALGVTAESWWHLPDELALEFVREAPRRFWTLVSSLLSGSSRASHPWARPSRDARVVSTSPGDTEHA
jgi:hypothetical protein